jgi:osmotically-inducible protein OsmY
VATTNADVERSMRDHDVKAAVRNRFVQMGLSEIEVEVRDGTVTLRGEIPSAERSKAVRAAAEASPDVGRVDDQLVAR